MLKHSLWIINAFGVLRISLRWTTWNVLSEKRIATLSLINTYGENKFTPYGLVSTSDGVGVVRAPITKWKSNIGVVSGVISATESESEESERFHFFRLRLRVHPLCSAYDLLATGDLARVYLWPAIYFFLSYDRCVLALNQMKMSQRYSGNLNSWAIFFSMLG